jgi:hypothetical protein
MVVDVAGRAVRTTGAPPQGRRRPVHGRTDAVQQRRLRVVRGDPTPVGVGDLVVERRRTHVRPAHCARGVVFQCTPRSAAASSSGQSREAALEGRAAARPPRSPRSFTCSPRPAHPAGRADAGRHPGPTAQAVDLPRLSAASPTPPVDRRGTVDQARNGMSTPSISQRSAVALRRQAPRSRTLSANARIWPTGWARPAGPVRRSVGNGTPRPSA